jgi:N-methylhydantoinase A/oxoprolinase/acetone carboxylase beta subunit
VYSVAVDIGGTFTDCAVLGSDGQIAAIAKSLSTPPDFSNGVINSIAEAGRSLNLDLAAFLDRTVILIHGCTVATNAMIERTGSRIGLITTRGHEDAIFIGKVTQKIAGLSEREIIHQSRATKADPPIVERANVWGAPERIDSTGNVVVALDQAATRAAIRRLKERGVESIAISLLWSFIDPRHEQQIVELLREEAPEIRVFASSDVAPLMGEYERTATTALTAYLGPRVLAYARDLERSLSERGFRHDLMYSHCIGGLTTLTEVEAKPLVTLDSGPAGGVLGASYFGRQIGREHVICADMGGTSFDVTVIHAGEPSLEEQPVLDKYAFLVPKIAVSSIGAGGGSIVWLDEDGPLRVGPQSAGSSPGPAAYSRGGQRPTVTDVNILLGYLDPDNFLGGRMKLDRAAAERALQPLADALKMPLAETAAGAFKIVNAHMADLIRKATIERGHDPRQFVLFCYGGAGPTHSPFLARELGIKEAYVPAQATVFSGLGMLTGGLVHVADANYSAIIPFSRDECLKLEILFTELQGKLEAQFAREGVTVGATKFSRFLYMKYGLQPNAMAVLTETPLDDHEALAEAFYRRYAAVFGELSILRTMKIEVLKCRVVGRRESVAPKLVVQSPSTSGPAKSIRKRPAYFEEFGAFIDTPIFDGDSLLPGQGTSGPAIVERPGSALVVPPGMRVEIDGFLNMRMEVLK